MGLLKSLLKRSIDIKDEHLLTQKNNSILTYLFHVKQLIVYFFYVSRET